MRGKQIAIIIPAFDPDDKLLLLLEELTISLHNIKLIVVNDGSKEETNEIFRKAEDYSIVLTHSKNYGKGRAIKTALTYIQLNEPEDTIVVIADADGQHTVEDINKVAEAAGDDCTLVLGSRSFVGNVPARSQFGNTLTRGIFRLATKVSVKDTQTGLRAFAYSMIPYLKSIEGDRYEYEMNVLLQCARDGIALKEVPIETIYLEGNQSSHFRVIKDSYRIYKEIIRFSCSSLLSFLIDYGMFSIWNVIFGALGMHQVIAMSNLGARFISSICNYTMNKKYVFKDKESVHSSAVKYFTLVVAILAMNTLLLMILVHTILPNPYAAKIIVEIIMFIVSYYVQKHFVFHNNRKESVIYDQVKNEK
ncbi:GtrA family protein [Anaerosporobacter sp.]